MIQQLGGSCKHPGCIRDTVVDYTLCVVPVPRFDANALLVTFGDFAPQGRLTMFFQTTSKLRLLCYCLKVHPHNRALSLNKTLQSTILQPLPNLMSHLNNKVEFLNKTSHIAEQNFFTYTPFWLPSHCSYKCHKNSISHTNHTCRCRT